jgi:hypothetical protein
MWDAWLQIMYLSEKHSSLNDGVSPETAFHIDSEPLRLKNEKVIVDAPSSHKEQEGGQDRMRQLPVR